MGAALVLCLFWSLFAGSAATAEAKTRTVSVGAYVHNADNHPELIDNFNSQVGRDAAIVLTYKGWDQAPVILEQLDGIWNHGAVPMITWEPWTSSEAGIPLGWIAQGRYDGYVRQAAQLAAAWDKPLLIRFGQEMNGDWFPWGGRPAAFKAAWRHLVKVFRQAGADKVHWVWNPYVNSRGGTLPFAKYYPGAEWVDWAGLDVVNWGGRFPWRSFNEIAGASYNELTDLTSKPIIIGEAGTGELGGSKAHWLKKMLRTYIPRMKQVRAVAFWSKADPRGDLRVDSSAASLNAVRRSLASPLYESSRRNLLSTPLWLGR